MADIRLAYALLKTCIDDDGTPPEVLDSLHAHVGNGRAGDRGLVGRARFTSTRHPSPTAARAGIACA